MIITSTASSPLTDDGVTVRSLRAWGEPCRTRVDLIELPAGSSLPAHPAGTDQTMFVLSGEAEVAGDDDVFVQLAAGRAVSWIKGERHTTVARSDLAVLIVQTIPVEAADHDAS